MWLWWSKLVESISNASQTENKLFSHSTRLTLSGACMVGRVRHRQPKSINMLMWTIHWIARNNNNVIESQYCNQHTTRFIHIVIENCVRSSDGDGGPGEVANHSGRGTHNEGFLLFLLLWLLCIRLSWMSCVMCRYMRMRIQRNNWNFIDRATIHTIFGHRARWRNLMKYARAKCVLVIPAADWQTTTIIISLRNFADVNCCGCHSVLATARGTMPGWICDSLL